MKGVYTSEDDYFEDILIESSYETGHKSIGNHVLEQMYDLSPANSLNVLKTVFERNFDKHWNVVEKILHVLSEEKFEEFFPVSNYIVRKCINVDIPIIQDLSLRCIENWENPGFIEILKNFKSNDAWLNDYAKEILKYAEENWEGI